MVKPAFKTKIMESKYPIRVKYIGAIAHKNEFVEKLTVGVTYTAIDQMFFENNCVGYKVQGFERSTNGQASWYDTRNFQIIASEYENISKELANEAIKENIEVDVPVKKEVVNN
jgi:hypothetical protein